ncbi:MAG: hypothetical protein FJ290_06855 [Planctomycetes bacterium]|nr:hypothetical protein [Planctomycetota bacterium]
MELRRAAFHSFVLALCLSRFVSAERTLNHGLHGVPAPGKVVIDGELGEWDMSGAITCCKDVEHLLDTESVRVAAMWDAEALYLSFVFRDATPMVNKIDPATMVGNGWRSDAVQLRCNMAGFISHVDCWYYTPGRKPAMTIHYGPVGGKAEKPKIDRPVYPEQLGAQQAFRAAPDGKGYTQEIKLPWKVITSDGKAPVARVSDAESSAAERRTTAEPSAAERRTPPDLRLGLEMFWGDADAQTWPRSRVTDNLAEGETQTDFFWTNVKAWGRLILEEKGKLTLPPPPWMAAKRTEPPGLVPITFEMPHDGFASIAIEDAAGNRVCSLLGGVQFAKGSHTVFWSGLSDRNEPLPLGKYRWVGLTRGAIDLRWRMSFYQPNRTCPWANSDGTGAWGPDHGNLQCVATGEGRVFLGGLGAEAGFPLFAVDEQGNKLWTAKSGEPDHLAFCEGILYAYTSRGDSNWLGIAPRGIMQFEAATGRWLDLKGPDGKPTKRLALLGDKETAAGFAALPTGLFFSIKDRSLVRMFDRNALAPVRDFRVPDAGELCAAGDGRLLVATKGALVELSIATGDLDTVVKGEFTAAQAIVRHPDGTVYVAFGAPLHQVQCYWRDFLGRRRVTEIGKRGGRTQNGWYEPSEGFINPSGLALDSTGRLWVVENSQRPKRVSVWKGRRWQRDFIGDTGYGGGGVINPLDPTMAFYRDMQFRINLGTGDWSLRQVGLVLPEGAEKLGITAGEGDRATGSDTDAEYMMAFKGRAYIHKCRGARQVFRERRDRRWALCAHIDPQKKVAWLDRDDDCRVDDDEVVRGGKDDDWGGTDYWGLRPSQNLDLFFSRGVNKPGLRLRCVAVTPGGTPLYDLTRFEPMGGECQNGIGLRDGSYNSGCAGERGDYFSEMRRIWPAGGSHLHLAHSGHVRNEDVTPRTFWFRGEHTGRWTYRLPEPGVVLYPFQAHGVADLACGGEVVCWVSDFGQRYLFTDDMLYIAQLFADARSSFESWPDRPQPGFLANKMAPGQESFHGYFTRVGDGRYLLTSGFTDCRVFEITGLDTIRRISGETEIRPQHLPRIAEIRQFRLTGGRSSAGVTIPRAAKLIALDGKLDEWSREGGVEIEVDAERGAQVLTAYDDANLYVAWDVRDPSAMLNKAPRWELAFKGGDAVDLFWRAPGEKLDEAAPRAGDLRLLITELDGKPRAVLYRPVSVVGGASLPRDPSSRAGDGPPTRPGPAKRPFTFDAFEGAGRPNAVTMDEVRLADEVKAAIAKGSGGYLVEAAIPWALLGVVGGASLPRAEGRIDFGVLFSDPRGTATALRACWHNRDTNITSDIPTEARLQPANWGAFRLAK